MYEYLSVNAEAEAFLTATCIICMLLRISICNRSSDLLRILCNVLTKAKMSVCEYVVIEVVVPSWPDEYIEIAPLRTSSVLYDTFSLESNLNSET